MSATSTTKDRHWLANVAQIAFFVLAVKPFMALFIGLRVRGREHLPRTGPFILFANHSSHLDTISLLSLFPARQLTALRPVAAADYFESNRRISFLTRTFFNILPIARREIKAGNNPLDRMCKAIEAGHALIIFPEGTRGTGEKVGEFRAGIAHLIEKAPDVPVIPACLINMGRSLPKGTFIPVPFFCEIRLGEPRKLCGNRQEILQTLADAIRELQAEC